MRIISGEYKNRKLVAPKDLKIRPTMDRTKEALFNIINHNIYDKSFLDLFAGSGSISCEAISRGASYVVCVDNNKEAIRIINENNKIVDNKISIINADVVNFIKTTTSSFDYIFVDPPYDIDIDVVNIGNMHFSEGKKSISEKVYVDDKDLDDLNYIKSKVKEIYIRDTPNSKKEKF